MDFNEAIYPPGIATHKTEAGQMVKWRMLNGNTISPFVSHCVDITVATGWLAIKAQMYGAFHMSPR